MREPPQHTSDANFADKDYPMMNVKKQGTIAAMMARKQMVINSVPLFSLVYDEIIIMDDDIFIISLETNVIIPICMTVGWNILYFQI